MPIANDEVRSHQWLTGVYADSYFPAFLLVKVKAILLDLCEQIERERPEGEDALLRPTHAATERINALAEEFGEHGSELETVAREEMAADFHFVACSYGFGGVDVEDVIAPRDG